jgi:hypothetical protein
MDTTLKLSDCVFMTRTVSKSPIAIELLLIRDITQFKKVLKAEEIMKLHAIFFDPTLITDIGYMEPDSLSFGLNYVELSWIFKIRTRQHLVTIRLPEQKAGVAEIPADPLADLRAELAETRVALANVHAELAETRSELAKLRADASHIIENRYFGFTRHDWHPGFDVWKKFSMKTLELLFECLGTPYGAYTDLDQFYSEPNMARACAPEIITPQQGEHILELTQKFVRAYNITACEAEIRFNRSLDESIMEMSLEYGSSNYDLPGRPVCGIRPDAYGFRFENFHILTRGIRTTQKYVYVFRFDEQEPPENYEAIFDFNLIIQKKLNDICQFFPRDDPPRFPVPAQILGLRIYKVLIG